MFSFGSDYYGKTAIPMTINSERVKSQPSLYETIPRSILS